MVIGICDDNSLERSRLERVIREFSAQVTIVAFPDGASLVELIRSGKTIDILFLDIDLGEGIDGMKSASIVREITDHEGSDLFRLPLIIFTTGFPERMREAFGVHAFDFLVKPIEKEELLKVLTRAVREANLIHAEQSREKMLEILVNGRAILIPVPKLVYVESQGRKLVFHVGDRITECYGKQSELLPRLGTGFCQVHRSYIINLSFVEDYSRTGVTLTGGFVVPMAKDRYRSFIEEYLSYGSRIR